MLIPVVVLRMYLAADSRRADPRGVGAGVGGVCPEVLALQLASWRTSDAGVGTDVGAVVGADVDAVGASACAA